MTRRMSVTLSAEAACVRPFAGEAIQNEAVNRVDDHARLHRGNRWPHRHNKRPVQLIFGALVDPFFEQLNLHRRNGFSAAGRRHLFAGVGGGHAANQFARGPLCRG